MKTIATEITINAAPEQVWEVLMNHEAYPNWNPFILKVSGEPVVGQTISTTIQIEGRKPDNFTPTVLKNETGKEFRWLGSAFIKGLFDGEHYFKLEAISANQTKLIHGENFSGLLAGMVMKKIGDSTLKGFEAMNAALKKEVENKNA